MANKKIIDFPTGSISDSSLGAFGDPSTGALSQTGYRALKDYFTAGITVDTGSLLPTASFNAFTSSINGQVTNVLASQSNYTQLSLFDNYTSSANIQANNIFASQSNYETTTAFNAYSSSTGGQIANVFASQSNYETVASFNTYSGSTATTINNVFASQSNYTLLTAFNTFTGSDNTRITNVFASQSNYLLTSSYVAGGGGTISGSGTLAQVALFSGSTFLTSSGIYQTTSSTIAIGANNDNGFGFSVNATAYFTSSATFGLLGRIDNSGGLRLYNYAGGSGIPITFKNNGSGGNLLLTLNDASAGGSTFATNVNVSASLRLAPGGTAVAQLHFVSGSAPTSPVTGDVWFDSANTGSLKIQLGGVTRTFQLV